MRAEDVLRELIGETVVCVGQWLGLWKEAV